MEVEEVLHMNKGDGETSYAKNSTVQSGIISIAKPILEEAIQKFFCEKVPAESIGIADLGCSSGPNALSVVSYIMEVLRAQCCHLGRQLPEFRVFLNDLYSNDFNNIFSSLPAFYERLKEDNNKGEVGDASTGSSFISSGTSAGSLYGKLFSRKSIRFVHSALSLRGLSQQIMEWLKFFYNKLKEDKACEGGASGSCFISGTPGSFYGRLFPRKSIHFVHSSSSLHWLSQAPAGLESNAWPALNKGRLYISKSSPRCVLDAYLSQFQKDFSLFLRSRSEEMTPRGRMVLSFIGRASPDPTTQGSCYHWELLAQALMSMAHEGLVKEEKIDSFNAPYYAPCEEEIKQEIEKEGSFMIDRLEGFEVDWDGGLFDKSTKIGSISAGKQVAKTIRAVVESMLQSYFGEDMDMDGLFRRYAEVVGDHLSTNRTRYFNVVVSMIRKA